MKIVNIFLLLLGLMYLFYPTDAYAYLNPGSGSDFFQLIMSFFAGIFTGIKVFFGKIKSIFVKNKEKDYE